MDLHAQDYACRQVRLPGIEAWYLLQYKCNTFLSYKRRHLTSYSWKKGVEDCLWFNWWILSVGGTAQLKFSGPTYFVQTTVGLTFSLWSITADTRAQTQASSVVLWVYKVAVGKAFLQVFEFSLVSVILPVLIHISVYNNIRGIISLSDSILEQHA